MRLIDISREKKIFHGSFTDVKIRWISDENENTENSGAIPPAKTNSDHILKMVATLNRERTCCVKNYYYVNPIGKPYSISRTIWFGCYGNALVNFYQQLPRTAFDRHVWYVCVWFGTSAIPSIRTECVARFPRTTVFNCNCNGWLGKAYSCGVNVYLLRVLPRPMSSHIHSTVRLRDTELITHISALWLIVVFKSGYILKPTPKFSLPELLHKPNLLQGRNFVHCFQHS